MKTTQILIAGFGGQGILFAGKFLAYKGLLEDLQVSWLPSYGPEMRGGTANCSVCLSDSPIGSPLVLHPDILMALNAPSFDKFIGAVVPGGVAVIDSSLISQRTDRTDIKAFYIPATQLAAEQNLEGLANIIAVGKILKETGFASLEAVEKGIRKSVPARKQNLVEANLRAVRLGMEL